MGDRSLDDEDFEYGAPGQGLDYDSQDEDLGTATKPVHNQPHDEEVALSESGSGFVGGGDTPPVDGGAGRGAYDTSLIESQDDIPQQQQQQQQQQGYSDDGEGRESDVGHPKQQQQQQQRQGDFSEDGGEEADGGGGEPGEYNAAEFKHLNVSDEVRELFKYIGRYKAHTIDLATQLKPFVPDYIPSVGGIDEFIKVPRPDGKPDFLGLKVLDEPASKQSDPTVLTLQLRQHSKEATGSKSAMVGRIDHADGAGNKAKKIEQWVTSIAAIQKSKPAANVMYSRRMPEIEDLMQEWLPEMEEFLKNMKMPEGELDIDLKAFVKLICGVLDIPVYENPIESLHVLFSLYLEFKSNPIFQQQLDTDGGGYGDMGAPAWSDPNASIGTNIANMSYN
ncbi:hypothetical protein FOA52_012937 [Chlamydomonas sp. UWO 241]|nr:hypothetical protein FOA52_012937 [Chlamydomonas sp. UWO 241]